MRMIVAILLAIAAAGGSALAQGAPPPARLSATVIKLDADRLDLTDETGRTFSLKVPRRDRGRTLTVTPLSVGNHGNVPSL